MALTTFRRHEKKYLLNHEQWQAMMALLPRYMEPDSYDRGGAGYTVYNIYFDTPQHDLIRHSLSKPSFKEKLRLRSYEVPVDEKAPVFLELKKKICGTVSKRRLMLPLSAAMTFTATGELPAVSEESDWQSRQVASEIQYLLSRHSLAPKVFISYERTAYFCRNDQRFRITFDRNLISRRNQIDLRKGRVGELIIPEDRILMEIKTVGAYPLWLTRQLSAAGIYPTSFSKYGEEYRQYVHRVQAVKQQVRPFSEKAASGDHPKDFEGLSHAVQI
ncbi:polyphosphate polymerase domain-containing protein [Anoxynatronum buryatiense]|uniref:VTC domain-containing protein n=1 Tax=Anoxynatronum buryatiense TaxID=489973 RepID=A0AA46AJW6_9CLOT|nr:polyphosphate polymerase domain-containing protein [Anoxynatronum buryatiense]SMP65307.1 VTC domain-containing protein [Anoxynatronum buryatiense]